MKVNLKKNFYPYSNQPFLLLDPSNDAFKTRLLERKQQQWKQENGMSFVMKINLYLKSFL